MQFTMILYTAPITRARMELVLKYGQQRNVPVISIHSAGFYSYFHINLPGNFPIVDTHPDSTATTDLRLLTPWKELSHFAASLPSTYKEKTAFRSRVASGARTDTPEGGEENFDEAVAAVLKTISSPGLPSSVREVFDYTPNKVHKMSPCLPIRWLINIRWSLLLAFGLLQMQ
jgi:amyloid beta precursor protein binding protein 1